MELNRWMINTAIIICISGIRFHPSLYTHVRIQCRAASTKEASWSMYEIQFTKIRFDLSAAFQKHISDINLSVRYDYS